MTDKQPGLIGNAHDVFAKNIRKTAVEQSSFDDSLLLLRILSKESSWLVGITSFVGRRS